MVNDTSLKVKSMSSIFLLLSGGKGRIKLNISTNVQSGDMGCSRVSCFLWWHRSERGRFHYKRSLRPISIFRERGHEKTRSQVRRLNYHSLYISITVVFKRGSAWEDSFLDAVGEAQDDGLFKHIRIARFASRTLDHELEKNTRSVIPYFSSTFAVMAIFSTSK